MPAWGIHLKVAQEIIEKSNLNLNKEEFLFGNVMVDAERYVVDNLSLVVDYSISHYAKVQKVNGFTTKLPDYERFIKENNNNLNHSIVLGYLVHIMTDYYYNKLTFENKFISDKNGNLIGIKLNNGKEKFTDKDNVRELKQKDFDMYAYEIYNSFDIIIDDKSVNNIYNSLKYIKDIKYSYEDVIKIVNYVNNIKKNYEKQDRRIVEYKVFTKEEFDFIFEKCINFLLGKLGEINEI